MKQLRLPFYYWAISIFIASCESDPVDIPLGEFEQGVLVINEGAFGANDGEISHYNPVNGEVKHNIFAVQNSRPFAGLIQDVVEAEGRMYLVANTGKVEVVDAKDFSSSGSVSDGLNITQSLVVVNDKLYISDWGPYDENFNNPDSNIAVVNDANGGTIAKKIPVSSGPGGMFVQGNNLLVACAAAKKLEVIALSSEELRESIDVEGTPVRFIEQGEKLYLFARDAANIYFHEINRNSINIASTVSIALERPTSNFSLGENGELFVITSTGWPDYNDSVAKVSITSGQLLEDALYSGSGFYGIGYNPTTKDIYIGDNNGFQGNGTVIIINSIGQEKTRLEAGMGPSGFVFK